MDFSKYSIFRLPNKHKRFDYTPRYYDPEQAERDEKLKKLRADQVIEGNQPEGKRISFRDANTYSNNRAQFAKGQSFKSNLRLIVILGGMILLFYYLLKHFIVLDPTQEIIK
ncbi:MAG: hypothetical protein IPM74_00715 [Crocinitomicaceae bacterium]|nr:hypothetical protein [Crocinitomicaceae bacterium]MBK8924439.1 hypothetical protein [Crocinitomicaceae bacterium]